MGQRFGLKVDDRNGGVLAGLGTRVDREVQVVGRLLGEFELRELLDGDQRRPAHAERSVKRPIALHVLRKFRELLGRDFVLGGEESAAGPQQSDVLGHSPLQGG